MDWTKVTNNAEVKKLLEQRTEIENKVKAIDENALIMYELELLSMPRVSGFKNNRNCNCGGHETYKTPGGLVRCKDCGAVR